MSISVVILTLDEAVNICGCISSLPWRNDVHVLDSGSTDGTQALATELGAKVTVRAFTDYADQRNAGLALTFVHDWVVMLDADERMTPELADEIEKLAQQAPPGLAMALVRRKDMFMDRWLRRSSGYPTWFPRFFRRGRVQVKRAINEEYSGDGDTVQLTHHLFHFPFNKGMDWWFERHNRYSALEADALASERMAETPDFKMLFGKNPLVRRRALKQLAYRMPLRPFAVFVYLYVLRLGFLDGRPGYHYATMRMAYEIMIDAKMATANSRAKAN